MRDSLGCSLFIAWEDVTVDVTGSRPSQTPAASQQRHLRQPPSGQCLGCTASGYAGHPQCIVHDYIQGPCQRGTTSPSHQAPHSLSRVNAQAFLRTLLYCLSSHGPSMNFYAVGRSSFSEARYATINILMEEGHFYLRPSIPDCITAALSVQFGCSPKGIISIHATSMASRDCVRLKGEANISREQLRGCPVHRPTFFSEVPECKNSQSISINSRVSFALVWFLIPALSSF